jgi:exopolyphosphatase/guanosine-5'-triphosphate,3'-diphosphate pyrophosphatase
METVRRAVIDIGTNSIKLLVADVSPEKVEPVLEQSRQTRLGSGFYQTRQLQAAAIDATVRAISGFVEIARQHSASSIKLIATSAAREAKNADQLTSAVKAACGLRVQILTGDQEADWVFKGVTTDSLLAGLPLLILDVGGGSAEFILGHRHQKHFSASFPLGTVRLLEQYPHSEPPAAREFDLCRKAIREFLLAHVRPLLDPALRHEMPSPAGNVQLAGTGGTASILARMELRINQYDRRLIEGAAISLERVCWHAEYLWSLPLDRRRQVPGLPPDRADVILTGVLIYEAILREFGFPEMRVSMRGLRFAAVLEP